MKKITLLLALLMLLGSILSMASCAKSGDRSGIAVEYLLQFIEYTSGNHHLLQIGKKVKYAHQKQQQKSQKFFSFFKRHDALSGKLSAESAAAAFAATAEFTAVT